MSGEGRSTAAAPTEAPSARRLRAARQRGQVATSRDLTEALVFLALVVVVAVGTPRAVAHLWGLFRAAFVATSGAPGARTAVVARAVDAIAALTLLPLAPALVVGVLAGALQTQGLLAWPAAAPELGRLSPGAGFARLAPARFMASFARSLAKLILLAGAVGLVLAPIFRQLPALAGRPPRFIAASLGASARSLGFTAAAAFVGWGLVDWALARRRHRLSLMTTRPEALRERRETEGDPAQKAARRRLHGALVDGGAVDALRDADFVVIDGAALALAVRYDRAGSRAPIIVSRGERLSAVALEGAARAVGLVVHRDVELIHLLAGAVEGDEIPAPAFERVAELLRATWGDSPPRR